MLELNKELYGRILDIGGGGEGIIGRLYQEQVVAIDNRPEELDEAPGGFAKLLMDATDLQFEDASFDHVTFFFTLMFMTAAEQEQAIKEAARVLKPGGTVQIWDCGIQSAYPEPFCIDVDILLPEEIIHTTYGVGKLDRQSLNSICTLCCGVGLSIVCQRSDEKSFYLSFTKSKTAS